MSYQIEICANSVRSAINAELGGAHRVELCDNLWEGGTTPSIASIELAKEKLTIPVFVLIRPRGGYFVYEDLEFEQIKRDIFRAKEVGADGIVSGILNTDGTIDLNRTSELIELARPLPFTFHRAFDLIDDPEKGLEELIDLGVDRILTSGQASSALQGLKMISQLLTKAEGRIAIMPGGGINEDNIRSFYEAGCREFHFSAKTGIKSAMSHKVPMNGSKDIPEDKLIVSDPEKVRRIKSLLDEMD